MRPNAVLCTGLLVAVALLASPVLAGFAGTDVFLPMAGRQAGAHPSNWYTTVWIHNPGTEAVTATVHFLQRNTVNLPPPAVEVLVAPGATEKIENVVESLFHVQAFGALRVTSPAGKLVVTSRVYSKALGEGESDSVGQDFAGVPAAFAIAAGEKTQVLGVHQTLPSADSDFRFNFGFVETTGHSATVRVRAMDEAGTVQGFSDIQVREFSQRQVAFKDHFPTLSTDNMQLDVEVISGTGKVIAYGSAIANGSQDPTTFEMTYDDALLGAAAVQHDDTLVGDGTAGAPLGIADGGVGADQLPAQVVTAEKLADAAVTVHKLATVPPPLPGPLQVEALRDIPLEAFFKNGEEMFWAPAFIGDITTIITDPDSGLTGGTTIGDADIAIADDGVTTTRIADGAVTPQKVSSAGATAGDVLSFDGTSVAWSAGSTGLTLPFYGQGSSPQIPDDPGLFRVENSGTGNGITAETTVGYAIYGRTIHAISVRGEAVTGTGVQGTSSTSVGVEGSSQHNTGVWGVSNESFGVNGTTHSDSGAVAGVWGYAPQGAIGVLGESATGKGVWGNALTGGIGVYGESHGGVGVYGVGTSLISPIGIAGVHGHHEVSTGVLGTSSSGHGVRGSVTGSGVGVVGENIGDSGSAAEFKVYGGRSTSPVVLASTNGVGAAFEGRSKNSTYVGYLGRNGWAVYGDGPGHDGYLGGQYGAEGESGTTQGYLGGDSYGAYGIHSSSGNYGFLGSGTYGVLGRKGDDSAVGYLGSDHGVYGRCNVGGSRYAGYFNGPVAISSLAGSGNRDVYADSNGKLIISTSDARLKKDVVDLPTEVDVLAALARLRSVTYAWDTAQKRAAGLGEQREIGMIAQEVEAVLPELVGEGADGYKSLDYAKLTAFLVEVTKAQQEQIERQRGEIDDLRQRLHGVESALAEAANR